MLERLQQAGDEPVALGELRARGIDFPAVVVSELELHGYAIERVHQDGRLICVRLRDRQPSKPLNDHRRRARQPRVARLSNLDVETLSLALR